MNLCQFETLKIGLYDYSKDPMIVNIARFYPMNRDKTLRVERKEAETDIKTFAPLPRKHPPVIVES